MKNHEELDQLYIDMTMQQKEVDAVEPSEEIVQIAYQNHSRIRRIVMKLLSAAKDLAEEEAQKEHQLYSQYGALENQERAERWIEAKKVAGGNWQVIVLKNPSVNAFVTPVCPKKIFVFAGLIQALNPTDDIGTLIVTLKLRRIPSVCELHYALVIIPTREP